MCCICSCSPSTHAARRAISVSARRRACPPACGVASTPSFSLISVACRARARLRGAYLVKRGGVRRARPPLGGRVARAPPTRPRCYFYSLRIAWPPPQGEAVRTPSFSAGYNLNLVVRSSFSFFSDRGARRRRTCSGFGSGRDLDSITPLGSVRVHSLPGGGVDSSGPLRLVIHASQPFHG